MSVHRHRAFTLLEMVVSMTIVVILMSAVTSTMLIARRALAVSAAELRPDPAEEAADMMAADLAVARVFPSRDATSVAMLVPDRDDDGAEEYITYGWAGSPGDPLLRTVNAEPATIVASDVQSLDLSWIEIPIPDPGPDWIVSPETVLHVHEHTGQSLSKVAIESGISAGAHFLPVLPPDTLFWQIDRVLFRAKSSGQTNGRLRVEVRDTDGDLPGPTTYASIEIQEWTLPSSYAWVEVGFTGLGGLTPDEPMCVLFIRGQGGGGAAGEIEYERNPLPDTPDAHMLLEDIGGWSTKMNRDVLLYVYGTYTTGSGGP